MKGSERLISRETADTPVYDARAAPPNNSLKLTRRVGPSAVLESPAGPA